MFDAERVEKLKVVAERCLTQHIICNPESGQATSPNTTCMRHLNHPGYFPADSPEFATLMESVADPRILSLLESDAMFGMKPLFRTTSLFANPIETTAEGAWHRCANQLAFTASTARADRCAVVGMRSS